jgi:crotonobetainyl-CoA:carnitine CoA-transferase CaiB-like acyl-CoA transferase
MSNYFKDLTVIELAGVLAGPSVGMFFSELGARVIKIENELTGGDATRSWKQENEPVESRVSAYFSSINYKKEYLFRNFHNEKHLEEIKILIKNADIVLTNFPAGRDKKYGFDYDQLKNVNPKLIYGHITGFGDDSTRVAYDIVLQAESGLLYITGEETTSVKIPIAIIDILAAHQLKEALLLALLKREKTGEGSYVHVSLLDAALASLTNQATNYLMNGNVPQKLGMLHPNIAPYGEILVSKDHVQFVLAVGNNRQFTQLCKVIKCDELVNDARFTTNPERVKNREALDKRLNEAFCKLNADQAEQALLKADVPFGRIRPLNEVFGTQHAQQLIREEKIEDRNTKRVTGIAFNTDFLD